ncbi:MAG: hypothetical protein U5K36_16555 [Roseovarius sp.]|nr:hypothetical protein [Roseovarius sp.]
MMLRGIAGTCLAGLLGGPALAQGPAPRPGALVAFLDTLLPADDFGPAASALGIDAEILAYAPDGSDLHRLIALGSSWLDGLDARAFADLPAATQHDVLRYMEGADRAQVPGRFYAVLRQFAMELYHARADTTAGLPLNPAPQPEGYPPPWN